MYPILSDSLDSSPLSCVLSVLFAIIFFFLCLVFSSRRRKVPKGIKTLFIPILSLPESVTLLIFSLLLSPSPGFLYHAEVEYLIIKRVEFPDNSSQESHNTIRMYDQQRDRESRLFTAFPSPQMTKKEKNSLLRDSTDNIMQSLETVLFLQTEHHNSQCLSQSCIGKLYCHALKS